MEKLQIYLKGCLIGMIVEYMLRVEYGHLQAFILGTLVLGMIIDVVKDLIK